MSEQSDKVLARYCQKMYELKIDHCVRLRRIAAYECAAVWSIVAVFVAAILIPIIMLVWG